VWLIQRVEWVLAVIPGRGVTNGIRANSRGFADVWLGSLDKLRMALLKHGTWAEELGIRTWPRESILDICPARVSWFDEDVDSLRVGGCETQRVDVRPSPMGQTWAGPKSSTVARGTVASRITVAIGISAAWVVQ
jgi:hypothetical protein